jgi:hypothetical protein
MSWRLKKKFASEQHLSDMITNDCPDDNKTVKLQDVQRRSSQAHFAFSSTFAI